MKKFAKYSKRSISPRRLIQAILFCSALFSVQLSAQQDSFQNPITLPEATIRVERFNRTGYSVWQADSLPTISVFSLSNRLFLENGLALRQNAPGTLSTVSARGAGPSRTAVIWNGLNLQSPMNGVIDASLVTLWPEDQLEVLQGGNSAAQSSGAMGGSVLLETPLKNRQGLSGKIGTELASFGGKAAQGSIQYGTLKVSSRLRAHWQSAENNFSFQKTGLNGQVFSALQQNNFGEKSDIQQFNHLTINKKNLLKTAIWYQNAFRQIPPALTEDLADTWQRDHATRAIASWEFSPNQRSNLQTRLGWQDEFIGFHFAGKTEESHAQTAQLSLEWKEKKGLMEWRFGGNTQYLRAASDGYKKKDVWYQQTRLEGFAAAERSFANHGKVSVLIRQSWATAQAAPFTWTFGFEMPAGQIGLLHGHISRNYNLPTFNDRFWETLNKLELLPEKGYSADLGWQLKRKQFLAELTAFQLILDDWILWSPSSVDGIFRPGNLRKVRSRGLELGTRLAFSTWGIDWKAKGHLQWSETENIAVYDNSQAVLGKQLPYTPKFGAGAGLWAIRGAFSGAYLHQFTGSRFVNTDNQDPLPGFQTGTLMLQYTNHKKLFWRRTNSLALNFALENIWNLQYESMANRPMPGRSWRAGILFGW